MSHTRFMGCAIRLVFEVKASGNIRTMASICDKHKKGGTRKSLTMENINPNIVNLQYAVRGPLVTRATKIQAEINKGVKKPFKTVIRANIGDAHAMGQKPITFIRQVLACVTCPSLIETVDYPWDVKERACEILQACGGESVGAYTGSYGIDMIRKSVAAFIERRDGHKANWEDICLCAGASSGIKNCLQLFCNTVDGKKSAVMIPKPQYPLYSASLAEYGLGQVDYYLDEENGWALTLSELERAYNEGLKNFKVRAVVVINPGNPTGQVLTRENIEMMIKFAQQKNLFILADEVYQDNVYVKSSKFFAFKKVIMDMGKPYNQIELVSFMSASKGYMGECGLRGGWMEIVNMDPGVQANLYKAVSAMLCPSSLGQTIVECVARPPKQGDPSYKMFVQEKEAVMQSLAARAMSVVSAFNQMKGFKCSTVQGALYAFPRISLPPRAVEAAKAEGKSADLFYAFRLLEEVGICVTPGSGFGQRPGTWHFRTTILPQPPLLKKMLQVFQSFHAKFTKEFS